MIDEDKAGEYIVDKIKQVMGEDSSHFYIKVDQLLASSNSYNRCYLISFCPTEKALANLYCFPRDKNEVLFEFIIDLKHDHISMFDQEEGKSELSLINIYSKLYWTMLYE